MNTPESDESERTQPPSTPPTSSLAAADPRDPATDSRPSVPLRSPLDAPRGEAPGSKEPTPLPPLAQRLVAAAVEVAHDLDERAHLVASRVESALEQVVKAVEQEAVALVATVEQQVDTLGAALAAGVRPTEESDAPLSAEGVARAGFDVPSSTVAPHAGQLETLSMARLYAEQGSLGRALELYDALCRLSPDDTLLDAERAAVALRAGHAAGERRAVRPVPDEPASPEPFGMLDLAELPERYHVDACELLCKDPSYAFFYWELTDAGLASARAQLGPFGAIARRIARLFCTVSTPSGTERIIHDLELHSDLGQRYLQLPRPGVQVRAAIGLLSEEGFFAPIAQSSLLRMPSWEPVQPGPVEWLDVRPRRAGDPLRPAIRMDADPAHQERGLFPEAQEPSSSPPAPSRPATRSLPRASQSGTVPTRAARSGGIA